MKKRFSLLLSLSLISLIAGCSSGAKTAYDTTFVYGGYNIGYTDSYNGTVIDTLFSQNFSKIDWTKSFNDPAFSQDVSTIEKAKAFIENKVNTEFSNNFKECTFTFSSQSEKKLTISYNNKTEEFAISENSKDGDIGYYTFFDSSNVEMGTFYPTIKDNSLSYLTLTSQDALGLPDSEYYQSIFYTGEDTPAFIISVKAEFVPQK